MGATYTRQSTYADGDTITAAHTNDEFDQLLAAFQASSGHTHDGTANEGGPVTKLLGNTLTFGAATAGTDITITFDGESNDGVLKWMEDEDYFEFSDDILIASTEKLQFRDTAIYINSSTDGQLDLVADTEIQIAATTIDINGAVDISGNLTVNGTLDLADGNFTNLGSIALDTITNDGTDITLDSSGDIILDAGGANVTFKDDGTSILDIANANSGDAELTVSTADKNFAIKGTDGSSAITALDIDMALAGKATFNGDVVVGGDLTITGDDLVMGTNTDGHILVADGSNFNPIAISSLSAISSVANDDILLAIDADGGVGLKKITRSTLVSGLATSSAISNVIEDTSPQLGGDLDVNGNGLVSTSNGNIALTPNGSGVVRVDGSSGIDMQSGGISIKNSGAESYVRFYCEDANQHYTQLQASPHSAYSGNVSVVLPASADTLVGKATTDTLTNKTLTSPVLNTATVGTSIVPSSADGATLGSASAEFSDLFLADGGTIQLGNDQDVRIIHDADDGLILKSTATGDDNPFLLTLQTGETDIASGDVLGQIDFQAPDEGTGTDAILVAAGIAAVSEGDFSSSSNATKLSFRTASSEAASEKMSLSSAGLLTVADDIVFKDGGTIGVASATDAMTVSSGGIVTFKDDILIKDGGTIGSASDADAITIAANGQLTLTQQLNGTAGDFSGDVGAATFQPDGDTSSGDNAAIGYTAGEGLILTGQGSTTDVTIKNDADATVASIATGTTIFTLNDDVFVTGRAAGTQTADNDGNFDLTISNYWTFTPDGNDTITLTNPAVGQSGIIYLDNSGGHNLSAHASIAINADVLSALDTAGKYMLSYYCTATSGNDTILMSATGALT